MDDDEVVVIKSVESEAQKNPENIIKHLDLSEKYTQSHREMISTVGRIRSEIEELLGDLKSYQADSSEAQSKEKALEIFSKLKNGVNKVFEKIHTEVISYSQNSQLLAKIVLNQAEGDISAISKKLDEKTQKRLAILMRMNPVFSSIHRALDTILESGVALWKISETLEYLWPKVEKVLALAEGDDYEALEEALNVWQQGQANKWAKNSNDPNRVRFNLTPFFNPAEIPTKFALKGKGTNYDGAGPVKFIPESEITHDETDPLVSDEDSKCCCALL